MTLLHYDMATLNVIDKIYQLSSKWLTKKTINYFSWYNSLSKEREEEIWRCFGFKCWPRFDLRYGFVWYIHKANWCDHFNLLLKTGATRLALHSGALKSNTVNKYINFQVFLPSSQAKTTKKQSTCPGKGCLSPCDKPETARFLHYFSFYGIYRVCTWRMIFALTHLIGFPFDQS